MHRFVLLSLAPLCACGTSVCTEGSGTPSSAVVSGTGPASTMLQFTRDSTFDLFEPNFAATWSRDVATDASGAFSLTLQKSEMQSGLGSSLHFGTSFIDGDGRVSYSFRVHSSRVQAPRLEV